MLFGIVAVIALPIWHYIRSHNQRALAEIEHVLAQHGLSKESTRQDLGDSDHGQPILNQEMINRVQNNMQIMTSIVSIYLRRLRNRAGADERVYHAVSKQLMDLRAAVDVLSVASAAMSGSDATDGINLEQFLGALIKDLVQLYDAKTLGFRCHPNASLGFREAIALGLIVNEYVSSLNAIQPPNQAPACDLNLVDDMIELRMTGVRDSNGANTSSVQEDLQDRLVQQLRGTVSKFYTDDKRLVLSILRFPGAKKMVGDY